MLRRIDIRAPAKVNLYLKVLGKRSDGYHELLTLFERVSLHDTITIERRRSGITVTSDRPITGRPEDNLSYKAAKAALDASGSSLGVSIHIEKRIPIAAGLGGGSSDAAATLRGVNTLLCLGLSRARLMELGGALGSDVPFFLTGARYAIGKGRGEELARAAIDRTFYHLLVTPPYPVLTKEVYAALGAGPYPPGRCRDEAFAKRLTKRGSDGTIKAVSLVDSFWRRPERSLHNDLQDAAIRVKEDIAGVIARLAEASMRKAILSGSGPSVFSLFDTRREALAARRRFEKDLLPGQRRAWNIVVVRTA